MAKSSSGGGGKTAMTQTAASRIQAAAAKAGGGKVASGSFAARAQSAAAKNDSAAKRRGRARRGTCPPNGFDQDLVMKYYCKDKMIDALVKELRLLGWGYRKGRKHVVLIAPGGRRLSVPSTPSDWRAYKNFRRDVRAVQSAEMQGCCCPAIERSMTASAWGDA